MFHYSTSRNQRNKGSKVKKIIQVALLLGVVIWLLYQVKHSHDKKNEYEGSRIRRKDDDVFSGRKEKPGYERNVNLDNHDDHFDEILKSEETNGGQPDDFEPEKDGENVFAKETDESQEDVANIHTEEHEQEQIGDNIDSYINDGHEVNIGGTREDPEDALKLDGKKDEINFSDQNGEDGSLEENEHQKDDNVIQMFTLDKENNDNMKAGSVNDEVHERGGVDSQEGISSESDNTIIATAEDANNIASLNDEHNTAVLPTEEDPASTNNENAHKNTDEPQGDTTSSETTEEITTEAANTNPRSVEEVTTSSSLEQEDIVKPADNETPQEETVQSQPDATSEDHTTEKNPSEETTTGIGSDNELLKLPLGNDQANLEMTENSEVLDLKSVHSEGGNATITEVASNLGEDKVDGTTESDITTGDAVGSNVASEVENVGNNPSEEAKTEESSVHGAANSSDNNEQVNVSNDGELGGSQGDSVSLTVSATGGSEDAQAKLKDENETISNSGNNVSLLVGNANEGAGEEARAE